MFTKIFGIFLNGLEGHSCEVECSLTPGFPYFHIVGLPPGTANECSERVRAALKNSDFKLPAERLTLNLRPPGTATDGPLLDLPIALSILGCQGLIPVSRLSDTVVAGELSLDGHLQKIRGALSLARSAKALGFKKMLLPADNVAEASLCGPNLTLIGIRTLNEAVEYLRYETLPPPSSLTMGTGSGKVASSEFPTDDALLPEFRPQVDMRDIHGQEAAKRALTIAAAGFHNLLLIGPPGIGKSMLAQALPGLMPPLLPEERQELVQIYSVIGKNYDSRSRPFRCPNHSIPATTLLGGGSNPRPGEISLAHRGVLFLDELSEYSREKLEALRLPMEEHEIRLQRLHSSALYPADFLLAAGMNPCPCGYYPDKTRCHCQPNVIDRYLRKVSGPLLDRLDMVCVMEPIAQKDFFDAPPGPSSADIYASSANARDRQAARFRGSSTRFNGRMTRDEIGRFCTLSPQAEQFLRQIYDSMGLSARSYNKVLTLARTIADLADSDEIHEDHLAEAAGYRGPDIFK